MVWFQVLCCSLRCLLDQYKVLCRTLRCLVHQFKAVAYARGGVSGVKPLPVDNRKKNKTYSFWNSPPFLYIDFWNCCHVFLCYPTCFLISRNFHRDAIIPVVKLFWWAPLEPTINSKCKPGQSQWVLLKLELCCDVIKPLFLRAIMAGQHNVPAQKPRYSWKRMNATQADGPLAMS